MIKRDPSPGIALSPTVSVLCSFPVGSQGHRLGTAEGSKGVQRGPRLLLGQGLGLGVWCAVTSGVGSRDKRVVATLGAQQEAGLAVKPGTGGGCRVGLVRLAKSEGQEAGPE